MDRITRLFRTLSSIAVAAAVLLPAASAVAQGTSGSMPGPINSRQLASYADLLLLSPGQRLAMEAAHDAYRQQFRGLRDGEIASFLEEQRAVQGGIPQRDVVEDMLEKMERLHAKIGVLDNGLFDRLLPVLSDEQRSMVPRLRMARERRRYEVQQTAASFGRRTVDLSVVFHDLDLEADDAAAADATIASYERRLTTIMRKQNKALTRMTLDLMDVLGERGYTDISQEELMKDPKLLQEVVAQIGEVYGDLRARSAKFTDDIRDLNERTRKQVAAVLPVSEARRFRNAFYRRGYPELAVLVARSADDWMTKARKLDDLTEDQRSLVEAAADEHQRRLDRLLTDAVGKVDHFWADFSPFKLNQDAAEQLREDMKDLRARAEEAGTRAEQSLEQSLGADAVAEIRLAAAKIDSRSAPAVAAGEGEDADRPETDAVEEFAFSGDRFLPDRMSGRDIRRYAKQLRIEDEMSDVLSVLHTDYLERLSGLEVLGRLRDARNAARPGAGDGSEPPTPEEIDLVYELRRQAIDAMASVDAAFFEDLRTLIGEEKEPLLDRVRRCRVRRSYAGSASARLAFGRDTSNEASVDLVSIVLEAKPSDDDLDRVDDILTAYEERAMDAFRTRLDAQLEMQQLNDRWIAEITEAARADIAAVLELQNRYREVMREPRERVERTDRAVVELNRSTLERIGEEWPSDLAGAIRHAYDLSAFPSIYDDPASVQRHLAAALDLDDLAAHQRERLIDLGASYRAEYERLSREMIDHLGMSPMNTVGLDPEAFKQWQERQQQLVKFRFDRNELNGRAISKLRATLSEEQIRRIGGLPEPLGEDDFYFYR